MEKVWANVIGGVIIALSILLSIEPDGPLGFRINMMTVFLGILVAVLIYIALTFKGFVKRFMVPMRFCINCGSGMPADALYCPYCGHPPGFTGSPPITLKKDNL